MRAGAPQKVVGIIVVLAGLCRPSAAVCPGDCDDDGKVTVNELATSASIALGTAPVDDCRPVDRQGDSAVSADELVGAIARALGGCVNPLQGSDALDASARLAVSTTDSLQDFGFIGAFGGAAQTVTGGSGAATIPCTLGGSRDVACVPGLHSVLTTVYSSCIEPGATSATTVTRSGTVVQTVLGPTLCTSGIPDDADVTIDFMNYSETFARDGVITKTLKAKELSLLRHPLNSVGGQQITANGQLTVDSPQTSERFTQTFTDFRLTTEPQSDGSVVVTLNGAMNVDCLGDLQFTTTQAIRFRANAACPSAGEFEVGQPLAPPTGGGTAASDDGDLLGARAEGEAANATAGLGLQQLLFRAADGQIYQVLQNVGGEPDTGGEDIRVTTLVGTLGEGGACAETPLGGGSAAVAAAGAGQALSLGSVFKSARIADAGPPCFNPNGTGGAGRLCFGPGCSSDCVCQVAERCTTFTISDGTAIGAPADVPAASVVDQLSVSSGSFCSGFSGRSTYRFGGSGPSTRAGQCGADPADGFLLPNGMSAFAGGQNGSTVVFAYDVPLAARFAGEAAGFSVDRNGKNALGCAGNNIVLGGRSTSKNIFAPRITFVQDGSVNFDFDPGVPSIDRSLVTCNIPLLAACSSFPTPTPTPQSVQCPEIDLGNAPSVSRNGSTVGKANILSDATCGDGGGAAPEATFAYTASSNGTYQITVEGLDFFDPILYVRDGGCGGAQLGCDGSVSVSLIEFGEVPSGAAGGIVIVPVLARTVVVSLHGGQRIAIVVDGSPGGSGAFRLDVARILATPTPTPTPTPAAGGLADLVVTSLTAPSVATIGTQITVSATVTNQATRSAGAFQVSFVLSRDTDLSAGDVVLASCSYPALGAGATVLCNGTIFVPSLATGGYSLGVIADALGQLTESNEANNTRLLPGGFTLNGLPGTPTPLPQCPISDLGSPPNISLTTLSTFGRPSSLGGASCGGGGGQAADFSFAYTAPQTGPYSIDTSGSSFDTVLYVRDSCGGNELACNDDIAFGSRQSQVLLQLAAGQHIVIVVDGFGVANGNFVLNIRSGSSLPTNTPKVPTPTPTPTRTVGPTAPVVRIGSVSGAPGQRVSIDVTLDARGQAISDVSHLLHFDQRTAIPKTGDEFDCVVNPGINKRDTTFFVLDVDVLDADVTSFVNVAPIPSGRLYTCAINIAPDTPAGVYALQCTELLVTWVDGTDVEGACIDGSVTVTNVIPPTPTVTPPFGASAAVAVER